ncbi:hypothetical protein Trydic_g2043 [Trypoxylus dichotomus]
MHVSKIILLAAYFLTAIIAITANKETYTQQKKLGKDFLLGMRYGRSRDGTGMSTKQKQHRSDVFYLGSRYGKRSSDSPGVPLMYSQLCGNDNDIYCDYTGVSNLYRCIQSYRNDGSIEDLITST